MTIRQSSRILKTLGVTAAPEHGGHNTRPRRVRRRAINALVRELRRSAFLRRAR